ncbi:helix-turn-helix domain-containing protein [Streptomyces brasiliscabiei]|uniref:helix-turn-helix domain-containing protein n=1 Tax=Streptomyces brasiliscabiei TaxID=2736302 RepID=UPI001C118E41|nr:helix-turn-helix domain-containing protein [Streptomyces brasiliscabiei]
MSKEPRAVVTLTDPDRATLLSWSRSRTLSRPLAQRARIVLACAEAPESGDTAVAEQLGVSRDLVVKWRARFLAEGLAGLHERSRAGRPRKVDDEAVLRILTRLLEPPPGDAGEWSTRAMAAAAGLSQTTVSRIWRDHRLQTRAMRTMRPDLIVDGLFLPAEVRALAGLFLEPPTRVLAVTAHNHGASPGPPAATAPSNGPRNLIAVADALTLLRAPAATPDRASHARLRAFLQELERGVPADVNVHLLVDGAPAREAIEAWVDQHPRRHWHAVKVGVTWLDQVEALLTAPPAPGHGGVTGSERTLPVLRDAVRARLGSREASAASFSWTSFTYDSIHEYGEQRSRSADRSAPRVAEPLTQLVLKALLTTPPPPGERVKEAPLAALTGTARSSVRKALHVLAEEGLLDRLPGNATAVPHVDIASVLDLYAARSALGSVLMRRAALLDPTRLQPVDAALAEVRAVARQQDHGWIEEADLSFQDMVARATGLSQTCLLFERLTLRVRMFIAVLRLDFADAAADLIAREDARIFDAIRDGDGEEAARLWRVKVERSVRYMATRLPHTTFDPNLWAAIAGKPAPRPGDPRKSERV